jgi:hypothetical protein
LLLTGRAWEEVLQQAEICDKPIMNRRKLARDSDDYYFITTVILDLGATLPGLLFEKKVADLLSY